jgi:hypothetical protein
MDTMDYEGVFKDLLEHYCLFLVNIEFVDSVAEWCKANEIAEPDREKPLRLIANEEKGCKLVVSKLVPEQVMDKRINALSVRSALTNVASNKADMLDSDKKKLAYLFLSEFASTLPDLESDEILADNWVFEEMEKMGFFRE